MNRRPVTMWVEGGNHRYSEFFKTDVRMVHKRALALPPIEPISKMPALLIQDFLGAKERREKIYYEVFPWTKPASKVVDRVIKAPLRSESDIIRNAII